MTVHDMLHQPVTVRQASTIAAAAGVAVAIPAAVFVEPIIMAVAAGTMSAAAIMRVKARRDALRSSDDSSGERTSILVASEKQLRRRAR